MRRVMRLLLAAALAGVTLLAFVAPARAGGDSKFCRTLQSLSAETGLGSDTGALDEQQAASTAKALRKAAKKAPKAVKKSLKTLAAAYERIADGESLVDVINEDGTEIAEASSRYGLYYLDHCLGGTTSTSAPA